MDNSTKENHKNDWSEGQSFLNGDNKCSENGNSFVTPLANANSNNCSGKEKALKDELAVECLDEKVRCGLGRCTPKWLQSFASKEAFVVTFCLTWVLQGMFSTYFVSVITTIEKLFQLQSKETGMILSATEIGQISFTLLLTYYGSHGHRPRWIACGMVWFATFAAICSLPHFIFNYANEMQPNTSLSVNLRESCHPLVNVTFGNATTCEALPSFEQPSDSKKFVLLIFFLGLLGIGIGQTPTYTLGISYIDDNVAGRESALYFAITIGVRILGPTLGFLLGSICTSLFIHPTRNPPFEPTDPRWRGAWWLGLLFDSGFLMLASIAMFSFPERLKSIRGPDKAEPNRQSPKIKDFPKTIKRLLRNRILMLRTVSSVLHILPIAGLYTFLPKFLESQFRFSAYKANAVAG